MADYTFKGYANFVLENKIKSILDTKLDFNRFMTPDYSLVEEPGMIKKIHRYTGTGVVDDLARGEGNSHFIDAEFAEEAYTVSRTQGQAKYYDDDIMTDPVLIDAKVKYLAEGMVNDWTKKAIAEFQKSTNTADIVDWSLADWADAISKYAEVHESQEGLFAVVGMKAVPEIRKALNTNLMYVEDYIRTGAIGAVLGVPIYTSKALDDMEEDSEGKPLGFLATKDAVTAFIKEDVRVEQDRDIDKKENFIVADRYAVIALTDETKCIKLVDASESSV